MTAEQFRRVRSEVEDLFAQGGHVTGGYLHQDGALSTSCLMCRATITITDRLKGEARRTGTALAGPCARRSAP